MNYQTAEQLSELRLRAMRQEYLRQIELPAMEDLSFDERFAMIVTAQVDARNTSRITRLLKKADLRDSAACLSNIDFDEKRQLPKALIMQLSDCSWIKLGSNLIVTGATGVGKTYILSAFGREACMRGLEVRSFRVPRMLTDLSIGRGDGSYNKLLANLTKPDLLILDDFGLKQIELALSHDLLEVIEERHHACKSTAISAQLPVKDWPSVFKDATVADAIMDRLIQNAYRIEAKGPSRRRAIKRQPAADDSTPSA